MYHPSSSNLRVCVYTYTEEEEKKTTNGSAARVEEEEAEMAARDPITLDPLGDHVYTFKFPCTPPTTTSSSLCSMSGGGGGGGGNFVSVSYNLDSLAR